MSDWIDPEQSMQNEIDRLRADLASVTAERDEAQRLAERSTRRLVEMSEPGFIGAFAARDEWKARAEAAEAALAKESGSANHNAAIAASERERDEARRDAERYRWLRDDCYVWWNDPLVSSKTQSEPVAMWLLPSADMTEAGIDAAIDAAIAAKGVDK